MRKVFIKSILISSLLLNIAVAQTCKDYIPDNNPNSRYTNHNDGTVTDNETGLMWKQCVEGLSGINACTSEEYTKHTWQQALQLPSSVTFATYNDWRLPNLTELESLVRQNCIYPSINISLFPNTPFFGVWSSSPDAPWYSGATFIVDFQEGLAGLNDRSSNFHVRLVRSR